MKKLLLLSITLLFSFVEVRATEYICSGTTRIGGTIQFVYCAEDYSPQYNGANILIEDPVIFLIDLLQPSIYSISGHIELTTLDNVDFVKIYKSDVDTNFISLYGIFQGIQDIQIYTQETRYIAIEIYCYNGGISSTSGISLMIRPTNQTAVEQIVVSDKVGIGTISPTASLDVVGDVKIRSNSYHMSITPGPRDIHFTSNAYNYKFDKPVLSNEGVFSSPLNTNLTLKTYNSPRLTIDNTTGYVGIGTTEPQEMLHVNGSIRGNQSCGSIRIRTDYGRVDIGSTHTGFMHFFTDRPKYYFNKPISVEGGVISSIERVDLQLQTFNTTHLRIQYGTGNVGIGTATPHYKLDVAGKIHSDTLITSIAQVGEVHSDSLRAGVVKTGAVFVESVYGADFVFENNYQLRPLQEVYSYVQEHGHLPEIQSAADMQQNGVNMSEFQIQLLQKIEELTLYLIKQEQTIQELRQELENVK